MTADANSARVREKIEETLAKLATASRSFAGKVRGHTGIDLRELIDPDGDAVGSLVDGEGSAGAASLATPIDMIVLETWLLGQIGDRDELDLDLNTHHDLWLGMGAWVADTLKDRHGAFWLIGGDDPRAWRMGFPKVLLEVTPHVFAEKLLRGGQGCARKLIAELDRIRVQHDEADEAEGGKAKDKYGPQQYARIHSVPLGQFMVFDTPRLQAVWGQESAAKLVDHVREAAKKLPPANQPLVERLLGDLAKLDLEKPAKDQTPDRHLYEAIAQLLAMRRASQPLAVDVLEKLVLPAMHMGVPDKFPPLGEDDLKNLKQGADLFAVMVDVVPFKHQASEGGLLGCFAPTELGTPYPDRLNLEVGKGDWVAVNPARLVPMLRDQDPQRLMLAFDRFVEYVQKLPDAPRLKDVGRGLAETVARALGDLKNCVGAAASAPGQMLVFRLLPPPS